MASPGIWSRVHPHLRHVELRLCDAKTRHCILVVILILSAYTHLWNPTGFPDLFYDEGVYMRRAVNVLETGNPQEGYFHDHPYFGQLVLSGFLKIAGFPNSIDADNLEFSYLVPRLTMGIFAVLDTFLIYKIAEKQFGRRTAILASVIFSVMPVTWMLRRILLDTILLPFLLSSILLALHSRDSRHPLLLAIGSSLLLGLAIFTKITAVTMIPVVGYLVLYGQKNIPGRLALWISPVLAIPSVWPLVSWRLGYLEYWFRDVLLQAGRSSGGFLPVTGLLFLIDPIVTVAGFFSFAYAIYRRKVFLVLWFAPFLIFVNLIGFFQYIHYIMILPVICIGISWMLQELTRRLGGGTRLQRYCFAGTVAGFATFGLVTTSALITTDMTSAQFQALDFALSVFDDSDTTLLASPVYTWILSDVFEMRNVLPDYSSILFGPPPTEKIMVMVDRHYMYDITRGQELIDAYRDSSSIRLFEGDLTDFDTNIYPYTSMRVTNEGGQVDIRTNWQWP